MGTFYLTLVVEWEDCGIMWFGVDGFFFLSLFLILFLDLWKVEWVWP